MPNQVLPKQADKKRRLEEAAFVLLAQSDDETPITVDQIVQKAHVAKGTFYLYFHDKVQLIRSMITDKSSQMLQDAWIKAQQNAISNHEERFLFMINEVIEYCKQNPSLLKIMKQNLSWNMIVDEIHQRHTSNTPQWMNELNSYLHELGYSAIEAKLLCFMMIELTATVCYSAIMLHQPQDMDTMKPLLLKNLMKMIQHS